MKKVPALPTNDVGKAYHILISFLFIGLTPNNRYECFSNWKKENSNEKRNELG